MVYQPELSENVQSKNAKEIACILVFKKMENVHCVR